MPEALPAVTVPPSASGLSFASCSSVVSGRGCSSSATVTTAPLRPGTATGAISSAKKPSRRARSTRCCETSAKRSAASRPIPSSRARLSAVSGMVSLPCAATSCGLAKRAPMVVSNTVTSRPNGAADLAITNGARVMISTPPATIRSASPQVTARAASTTALRPLPHSRLTVAPATSTGRPASSAAWRPMLRLSSPAWQAQPRMTSST